ncbi:MAG TPA: MFS transporter, partial [Usitatibacter sp.]
MNPSRRNVFLLACCQALLLTNAVTLVAINGLAGYALAANKSLATLPNMSYVLGAAIATLPASLWMKRVGRRNGFLTGGACGLAGSALAAYAVVSGSMALLCAGTFLLGGYNAFGQYYRFAAADASNPEFKAKAISYVLAGGIVGGMVGPELSKYTRGLWHPDYAGSYASLFAIVLAAMAVMTFLRIPPPAESVLRARARPLRTIVAQPVFLVAASVAALGYAVM